MVFTDPLVEAIVTDAKLAGYPASAIAGALVFDDNNAAALDRHRFAERVAEALARPGLIGGEWVSTVGEYPLPYRMRALWRVLGCIYEGTDIHGTPTS